MKLKLRELNDNSIGSLSVYVMTLFGMTIMLYMFGFQSMWSTYLNTVGDNTISLTSPIALGNTFWNLATDSIYTALGTGATIGGILILGYWFRNNQAVWSFLLPVILLVALNIFVFPVNAFGGDLNVLDPGFATGFSFSIALVVFFNLFFILAVLEYMRGSGT